MSNVIGFGIFRERSQKLAYNSAHINIAFHLSENIRNMSTTFHQNSTEKWKKLLKNYILFEKVMFEIATKLDIVLLKRSSLSGAKICTSYRSRQGFSNDYLSPKFGFDRAENEPLKV